MRASELKKCFFCDEGIARKVPTFFTLTVTQEGLKPGETNMALGVEMMFPGAPGIAKALHGDPEVTKEIFKRKVSICFDCFIKDQNLIRIYEEEDKEEPE